MKSMRSNLNIVAIIQARMGSTRLPEKVMQKILEKPVILWDLDRVSASRLIDEIVVAVPYGKENDIIVKTIKEYNSKITVSRGSEDDVLDRYYKAAVEVNADVVVRITSDCPLIDPIITDHVIKEFMDTDCDYCANTLELTYPSGLDTEVFSFKALEKACIEANKKYEREHVTPYIKERSDIFKLRNVANNSDLSHLRLTLDTSEDLKLIETIYRLLYPKKQMFLLEDILKLFIERPELIEINKHIKQKKIDK